MSILTKRIPTLLGLLVLGAGIIGGVFVVRRVNQNSVPKEAVTPQGVRITNISDTQFTVTWLTSEAAMGKVFYGKVGENLSNEMKDDRDQLSDEDGVYETHHVTIKNLQPNSKYAFRIASGTSKTLFDKQGSPYSVETGPTLTTTPPADTVYGTVMQASTLPAEGAIVYVNMDGAVPASTLVTSSGNWAIPLSIVRTTGLSSYISYDKEATNLTVSVLGNKDESSQVNVSLANAAPVPKITLGQNYDFRTTAEATPTPSTPASGSGDLAEVPQTPGQFNVEPLGDETDTTGGSNIGVLLLNPAEEGETLATERPEFRGTGPANAVLSITVESSTVYSDNVSVDEDGTWSWTPPGDLDPGEHTITIAYLDDNGVEQAVTRTFIVDASDDLPAFESTPSATLSPSPSPSLSSTDSATVSSRVSMPSTDSGVPVSGILGPTWLTVVLGFAIIMSGALLLVL